jgi:hypothetical protein
MEIATLVVGRKIGGGTGKQKPVQTTGIIIPVSHHSGTPMQVKTVLHDFRIATMHLRLADEQLGSILPDDRFSKAHEYIQHALFLIQTASFETL